MSILQNWKSKMIVVILCAFVSAFSNYYSIKCIIGNKRIDLMGFAISDYYALLLTLMFDFLIIYFHLIKHKILIFLCIACSVVIAEYSWTLLIQEKISFNFQYFDFLICTFLALIPIVILNILMHDVAEELDVI
jgi:hypothetical protein